VVGVSHERAGVGINGQHPRDHERLIGIPADLAPVRRPTPGQIAEVVNQRTGVNWRKPR
jgi:hypothetical protein